MDGITIACCDLPLELIEEFGLSRLIYDRGGEKEVRFMRNVKNAILPVRHEGQIEILPWGSRTKKLPATGYVWLKTIESGAVHGAIEVEIIASAGIRNGIWFPCSIGFRGILLEVGGDRAVYMIVEKADYYFKVMTKSDRMPISIGNRTPH